MKAGWPAAQCILCLEKSALCEEHLIPRMLGGALTCNFLCHPCNSWLGTEVDASAKSDPSILLAVRELQGDIPKLSRRLLEAHPYVSTGKGPRVTGHIRDGAFQVISHQRDDGSLILPTSEAPQAIATTLTRSGYADVPIKGALETFENLAENQQTPVAHGLEVVKWSIEEIQLDLSQSKLMNPLLPAKVAYGFLALCAGEAICSDDWPLPELRRALATGILGDDIILRVERFQAGDSRPFHGICSENNSEYSQIQVQFFGCLAYRVHFPRLYIGGPRYSYTHCLETRHEDLKITSCDP